METTAPLWQRLLLMMAMTLVALSQPHCTAAAVEATSSIAAASALIGRYYPERLQSFNLTIAPRTADSADCFTLTSSDSATDGLRLIHIAGSSASMLTAGFHHYLQQYANLSLLTWSTQATPLLLGPLPAVVQTVHRCTAYRYRYYLNICTLSYSTQWWDWQRWEREIDWMALRAVNLPLALTGEELVWYELFLELGLSHADIVSFIAAPAFLAWQRMGNIQGSWSAPITLDWMRQQADLQLQILKRMRSLGMMPVLPGFNSYVPMALKTHYPNASITASNPWSTFPREFQQDDQLDPADPLFKSIGSRFISKLMERYGTDHFYSSDAFNEVSPKSNDTSYLSSVSAGIHQAMTAADPDAVWVSQNWLFVNNPTFWQPAQIRAWLDPVPADQMLILDLMSENVPVFSRTDNYYGKSFVWNMLHNSGGDTALYGKFDTIAQNPARDKASVGEAMVGLGATPEGLQQNEIMYDLLFDMVWHSAPIADNDAWVHRWLLSRYGLHDASAPQLIPLWRAYHVLIRTVWNCTNGQWSATKTLFELRPSLSMSSVAAGNQVNANWYNNSQLFSAWSDLIAVNHYIASLVDTAGQQRYLYDVVDIGKQYLANIMMDYQSSLVAAFANGDLRLTERFGTAILDLMADVDQFLATNHNFLLGPSIRNARKWGITIEQQDELEWNVRNQLTLWGPDGQITDYASKLWSGLVTNYYMPRWQLFTEELVAALQQNTTWDEGAYRVRCRIREQQWQRQREKFPTEPLGDTILMAQHLQQKYSLSDQQRMLSRTRQRGDRAV